MDVDLSGVESALQDISSGVSSIERELWGPDKGIDFSSFESLTILLLCVLGSVVGWRKVVPGLIVFILFDQTVNSAGPGESDRIQLLLLVILAWWGASNLMRFIGRKIKKAPVVPKLEESITSMDSSVGRALAKVK